MRIKIFLIMTAIAGLAIAAQEAADLDPFAFLAGRELSASEAAGFEGGEVRIDVDSARSRARVRVWDNEYESRLGRAAPIEDYTVEVHNRIVKTKEAPFYPTEKSKQAYAGKTGLTTKPVKFPAGEWNIIAVEDCKDGMGPNKIKSDAIGTVEVYQAGNLIGMANDCGYNLHSNTNDFSYSKSYGCIILKQEDNARLAASLRQDKANYSSKKIDPVFPDTKPKGLRQILSVSDRSH